MGVGGGGGGGVGVRKAALLECQYGTPQRGRVWKGVSPSHGGDFLEIWVLKTRFWYVINVKLTSNLARNEYDCQERSQLFGIGRGARPQMYRQKKIM